MSDLLDQHASPSPDSRAVDIRRGRSQAERTIAMTRKLLRGLRVVPALALAMFTVALDMTIISTAIPEVSFTLLPFSFE